MRNIVSDTRHAVRALRAQPGFAAVAILTLALGLGANTAVFSVLNSVILAPLPYDEPGQLVRLYSARRDDPGRGDFHTGLDILDVREQVNAFSSVGIFYTYREIGGDIRGRDGSTQRIRVLPVSADYFRTLRATPLLGRTFTRDEERFDARRVILSHRLWSTFAERDPAVIGRAIEFSGETYEVIGVMRPSFTDVVAGDVAAWIPHDLKSSSRQRLALVPGSNNRVNSYLSAIARLGPGVTIARAQAELDALMRRLAAELPNTHATRIMRAVPLHQDVVGDSTSAVFILMGAAGLVLLIACLNVANLFLARSVAQTRDTAIRTALGASRSRLIGQRLTESLVVAIAGGVVGVGGRVLGGEGAAGGEPRIARPRRGGAIRSRAVGVRGRGHRGDRSPVRRRPGVPRLSRRSNRRPARGCARQHERTHQPAGAQCPGREPGLGCARAPRRRGRSHPLVHRAPARRPRVRGGRSHDLRGAPAARPI